ncbi:MAG: response regulator, partial [Nitrospirae bacterium]
MPRVLVVDDDPISRDVIAQIVGACGDFSVQTAEDGVDALDKLSFEHFDVILSDIKMPRMDGIEFLKRAKELDPTVPVVMVTALNQIEPAVESMRMGASDFLTKPLRISDVKNVLDRLLAEKALIDSLKVRGNGGDSLVKLLNTELFKKLSMVNMLFQVSTEIERQSDTVNIVKALPETVIKVIPVRKAGFWGLVDDLLIFEAGMGFDLIDKLPIKGTVFERMLQDRRMFYVLEQNDSDPFTGIPLQSGMLIMTLMIYDSVFGFLVLADKKDGTRFFDDEISLLREFLNKVTMKLENITLYDITNQHLVNILKTLVLTIQARDSYTKRHSERVTEIALEIAEEMGTPQEVKDALAFGG